MELVYKGSNPLSLNLNFIKILTIIKTSYIQKKKTWIINNDLKTRRSSILAAKLQLCLIKQLIVKHSNKFILLPIYYKSLKLINDIRFFPKLRYSFFISENAFKRLTYLTPSAIFFLDTSKGLLTQNEIKFIKTTGRIIALCV